MYSGSDNIANASTLESTSTNRGEEVDIVAEIAKWEVLRLATIEGATVVGVTSFVIYYINRSGVCFI